MVLSPKVTYDSVNLCVKICETEHFDVAKIFDCGQCFRFDPVPDTKHEVEFSGVAFGRFVSFAQDGRDIYIYNSDERDFAQIWSPFLGLDLDYSLVSADISSRSENPALQRAIEFGKGIRILRQDPWEAICSFIISQNNNIPRIKKIIGALSQKCGKRIEVPEVLSGHITPETVLYSFPEPEALLELGVDGLFELKTGFRAKYIYDAAQKAAQGEIDCEFLRNEPDTEKCIEHLCSVKGIGPKVASCALLFGFSRYDAFPIDVWIKRVIQKYFSDASDDFSPELLGPYAGIAQQYLFYYERYLSV